MAIATHNLLASYGKSGANCDALFADVVLLCNCDQNSGNPTDLSTYAHTFHAFGTAIDSPVNPKFGAGALAIGFGAGDRLEVGTTYVSEFGLGTKDYTIEFFYSRDSHPANSTYLFFVSGSLDAVAINTQAGVAMNTFRINFVEDSATPIAGVTDLSLNTYYFIALSRHNGVTRLYINGVQEGSDWNPGSPHDLGTGGWPTIGGLPNGTTQVGAIGEFDEIRFTIGVGRYSSNFTPPIAPFAEVAC